jgi:hypothetical protein
VIERLYSKHEALSLNLSTIKKTDKAILRVRLICRNSYELLNEKTGQRNRRMNDSFRERETKNRNNDVYAVLPPQKNR